MKSFILGLLLAVNANAGTLSVSGPFSGLNDTDSSITLDNSEAQDLLNVEVSLDGLTLKKRKGYTQSYALTIATGPVYGSISYKDPDGNNVKIVAHDRFVQKSVNGEAFTDIISTATVGSKWMFCESNGVVYAFNSNHDTPWSITGSSMTYFTSMPKASICAIAADRMLLSGTTDYPNRFYFSESGDYTNFTLGTSNEDPSFDDVGTSGEKITALFGTESEWLIAKVNSIISYQGTNQYDLVASIISNKIGISDPHAITKYEGIVYFKGSDNRIWAYSNGGITNISAKIENFTKNITKDTIAQKTYTTKTDWDGGTYTNSTGNVTSGSVEPYAFTNTDTTDANFASGDIDVALSTQSDTIFLGKHINFNNIGFESGNKNNWTINNDLYSTSWNVVYSTNIIGETSVSLQFSVEFGTYAIKSNSSWVNGKLFWISKSYDPNCTDAVYVAYTYPVDLVPHYYTINISTQSNSDYYIFLDGYSSLLYSGPFSKKDGYMKIAIMHTSIGTYYDIATYTSSGTFISQKHTTSAPGNHVGYLQYTSSAPENSGTPTQIDWFVRHSSANATNMTAWEATTSYYLLNSTDTVWQYKANFYNSRSYLNPTVYDAGFVFKSSGSWESAEYDIGWLNGWSQFLANETKQTGGPNHWTYEMKSSTYSGGTVSATYSAVTPGSNISISTGAFVKVKASYTIESATATVRLNDMSYGYEFQTPHLAHAFEYKNDIYFAVPYGNYVTNNRLMKLDLRTPAWQIFDIPMNSPMQEGDNIYFGSPTGGYLYQYPYGDSDNGAAINSYWKSKNYIGDNAYVEKQFNTLSIIAGADIGSSLDLTYTMNTNGATSYTMDLSSSTENFIRNNRQLPMGENGTFFNLNLGNNAVNQPWSFYGASIDYTNNPWRVLPQ